eukprot:scaffold250517_cov44-Prasinocladus_malaysianus.AAC.1
MLPLQIGVRQVSPSVDATGGPGREAAAGVIRPLRPGRNAADGFEKETNCLINNPAYHHHRTNIRTSIRS